MKQDRKAASHAFPANSLTKSAQLIARSASLATSALLIWQRNAANVLPDNILKILLLVRRTLRAWIASLASTADMQPRFTALGVHRANSRRPDRVNAQIVSLAVTVLLVLLLPAPNVSLDITHLLALLHARSVPAVNMVPPQPFQAAQAVLLANTL